MSSKRKLDALEINHAERLRKRYAIKVKSSQQDEHAAVDTPPSLESDSRVSPSKFFEPAIEHRYLVVDRGSHSITAGRSGKEGPEIKFLAVIGTVGPVAKNAGDRSQEIYGEYIPYKHGKIVSYRSPFECPEEMKSSDSFNMWEYTMEAISYLVKNPLDRPLLLVEPSIDPDSFRETAADILFDLGVQKLHFVKSVVLSMFASGKTTGLVVECGHAGTCAVPIFKGYCLPPQRLNVSGRDLTQFLIRNLADRGHVFPYAKERRIVGKVKEDICYVALDFDKELKASKASPDDYRRKCECLAGEWIEIDGYDRFIIGEALFQPSIVAVDEPGIHKMAYSAITNCYKDIQNDLFSNIVLSGGSTLFPGFVERFTKEMKALAPFGVEVNVHAPSNRRHSAWVGASMMSSMPGVDIDWISKDEYEEGLFNEGREWIVRRKCYR